MKKRLMRTQIIIEICTLAIFCTSLVSLLFTNNFKFIVSTLLLGLIGLFLDEKLEREVYKYDKKRN